MAERATESKKMRCMDGKQRGYGIHFFLIICLLMILCIYCKISSDVGRKAYNELTTWLGNYKFDECCVGDDGFFMAMSYDLEIYQEGDKYYGYLEIVGQTTWITAKVDVCGNSEKIDIVFLENLSKESDFDFNYENLEGVLFRLERVDEKIITYWGSISPLMLENEKPGEYFKKESMP